MIWMKRKRLKYSVEWKEDSATEVNLLSRVLQTRYDGLNIFTS